MTAQWARRRAQFQYVLTSILNERYSELGQAHQNSGEVVFVAKNSDIAFAVASLQRDGDSDESNIKWLDRGLTRASIPLGDKPLLDEAVSQAWSAL